MEREIELEKLQRLRRHADYPLRLFLSALGRLQGFEEAAGGATRTERAPASPSTAMMPGRSAERGCPYCGRNAPAGRVRRAGAR